MRCVDARGLEGEYVHLLGLYLGDGCISRHARNVWRLRIVQDNRYVELIESCKAAIAEVSGKSPGVTQFTGCRQVSAYWKHWPCAFPQAAPGRKHLRRIQLEPWQVQRVERYPHELIKGLIESDGCRITNSAIAHGKRYEYPRYFFSNRSADIQDLFRWACDLIGVEYRQDGPWNISVARRRSVAILDEFIGPKR